MSSNTPPAIRTYKSLLEEKERLQNLLASHKKLIKEDIAAVKQQFKPVTGVLSFIGKLATRKTSNTLVNLGIDIASNVLIRRLFSKAGWFTKLVVPFIVANYSSHIMAATKNQGIAKISGFFKRMFKRA
jgi:uncharacterized membrane protein